MVTISKAYQLSQITDATVESCCLIMISSRKNKLCFVYFPVPWQKCFMRTRIRYQRHIFQTCTIWHMQKVFLMQWKDGERLRRTDTSSTSHFAWRSWASRILERLGICLRAG